MARKKELKRLIVEQAKDKATRCIRPHIINPTKTSPDKPFQKITNAIQRAVFILHISGFTTEEIIKVTRLKESSIYVYISSSYGQYPKVKHL